MGEDGKTEDEGPPPIGAASPPVKQLGRFILLEKIGEGGMGAVHAAHDPMLNRRVAIKLLRRQLSHASYGARMVREAQALAKLSHPNVVSVHDVGFADGQMFLAMEHIEGRALSDLLTRPTEWTRVLALFLDAGKGLAAAHAAGLVHRDFKPHNVMVGNDGRVRVLDFGLARDTGESVTPSSSTPAPLLLGGVVTQEGAVMGTPSYMSPEQHAGKPCDARSDQFSFCVSLWQGLYGALPFPPPVPSQEAETRDLGAPPATVAGWRPVDATPKRREVPRHVHHALVRGLSLSREDRFPSMEALLAELTPRPRRYPISLVYGLAAVTAALSVVVVFDQLHQRTPKGWWSKHRGSCNPVRVTTTLEEARAPGGALHGGGADADLYAAACLALAGDFNTAAPLADRLPKPQQVEASHLFYALGAPREATVSARIPPAQLPMMTLALWYSEPGTEEHERAAYYVALAELAEGDVESARGHLADFLQLHAAEDPWRSTAREALAKAAAP